MSLPQALDLTVWLGLVPATLALLVGAAIRRWIGTHPFVYLLGRAFLGASGVRFMAGSLAQNRGAYPARCGHQPSLVARWLMAWGDACVTGMLGAIFVAFKPHWLATWSDRLYLDPTRPPT